MEFTSILDLKDSPYKGGDCPPYMIDLNLDQVVNRIALSWGSDVSKYYEYFPTDQECEIYRRQVFLDVKQDQVFEVLSSFVRRMKERQEIENRKKAVRVPIQKAVLHMIEVYTYCAALEDLQQQLQNESLNSEGMKNFLRYLNEVISSEAYQQMSQKVKALYQQLSSFRIRLKYENDYILVQDLTSVDAPLSENYTSFLTQAFQADESEIASPFTASLSMTGLETEIIEVFKKKHADFFDGVEAFEKQYNEYQNQILMTFRSEVEFYLSFIAFEKMMTGLGHLFVMPGTDPKREMYAEGMYDLALACSLLDKDRLVVANSMVYHETERFFVLTGPNQGGKTTFARSLGQLIYFTKMGLDVPARDANVHYFCDILTHFSVEESIETGRGKLKEELSRLSPMMKEKYKNAFVIINELFTTAANYDACIMGQRVLAHFIGQGCHGIYVTHLKELSESHEQVVSLRAQVDEKNHQNFQIKRSKADDSACAINQVDKYQLRYEQLKERLS